jgi:hypothetical protein
MAKHDFRGTKAGDDFRITVSVPDIPAGRSIVKAWFTGKSYPSLPDDDAELRKIVTTIDGADGFVSNTGSGGTGEVYFTFVPADTVGLRVNYPYLYDIQVKMDNGEVSTVLDGTIAFSQPITLATT